MIRILKPLLGVHLLCWVIALFFLLPTHDDWGYLVTPHINGVSISDFFVHEGMYWRPVDAVVGCVTTQWPGIYPYFNHFLLAVGLFLSAYLLYQIMKRMHISGPALPIATTIFLVAPATLGTILGIDSINQMYSCCFGLWSILLFLKYERKPWWLIAALLATFSKENGIAYFVIPPLFAYGMDGKCKERLNRGGYGVLCILIYFAVRFSLPNSAVSVSDESPYGLTLAKKLTDLGSFAVGTTTVVDFISLIHVPSRNLLIVALTLAVSILFLILTFRPTHKFLERQTLVLIACLFMAASVHLVTHFGPMHALAPLPFYCLLVGHFLNGNEIVHRRLFQISFSLWLLAAIAVDWHHWWCTYQSCQAGPKMAKAVLAQTEGAPQKVLCITIDAGEPRHFSSFCLNPRDVFFGGMAVRREANWKFPKELKSEGIKADEDIDEAIARFHGEEYDCIWVMRDDQVVRVINQRRLPQ